MVHSFWNFINEQSNSNIASWIGYVQDGTTSKFFRISFIVNSNTNEVTTNCAARYIHNFTANDNNAINAYNNNATSTHVTANDESFGYGLKNLVLTIAI